MQRSTTWILWLAAVLSTACGSSTSTTNDATTDDAASGADTAGSDTSGGGNDTVSGGTAKLAPWTKLAEGGLPSPQVKFVAASDGNLFVGDKTGLYKSTDAGATFTALAPAAKCQVASLQVTSKKRLLVLCIEPADKSVLYTSTDAGGTFAPVTTGFPNFGGLAGGRFVEAGGRIFHRCVLSSADDGVTWEGKMDAPTAAPFAGGGEAYQVGDAVLCHATAVGANKTFKWDAATKAWTDVSDAGTKPLQLKNFTLHKGFLFATDLHAKTATDFTSPPIVAMYKSADGIVWSKVTSLPTEEAGTATRYQSVFATDALLFVGFEQAVSFGGAIIGPTLVSADGGATWGSAGPLATNPNQDLASTLGFAVLGTDVIASTIDGLFVRGLGTF